VLPAQPGEPLKAGQDGNKAHHTRALSTIWHSSCEIDCKLALSVLLDEKTFACAIVSSYGGNPRCVQRDCPKLTLQPMKIVAMTQLDISPISVGERATCENDETVPGDESETNEGSRSGSAVVHCQAVSASSLIVPSFGICGTTMSSCIKKLVRAVVNPCLVVSLVSQETKTSWFVPSTHTYSPKIGCQALLLVNERDPRLRCSYE
jgi:hypothetical protein